MNTSNLQKKDFSIVFDKVKQYNEVNLLSDDDFLKPEEILANEDIRNLGQICRELHDDSSQGAIIYQTFC